jgi:hypothetical protein
MENYWTWRRERPVDPVDERDRGGAVAAPSLPLKAGPGQEPQRRPLQGCLQ